MLSRLLRAARHEADADLPVEYPLEVEGRLNRHLTQADIREHLRILHGGLSIGGESYVDLYFRCLESTGTLFTPFNVFQRFQTRHDLLRYFFATFDVPGARVECGAYRGATALLLAHAWRSRAPGFNGTGLHLVDSFTGTRASTAEDFIPQRAPDGSARMAPFFPPGLSDVTPELVRGHFGDFPEVNIHAGWIPDALVALGDAPVAFVHVDLTLYEATLAALEFFYPRLAAGGVMLCDGSLFCPGVEKAVERYASAGHLPYVTLGHRQFVLRKP